MSKTVSIRGAVTAENDVKSISSASIRLIERIYFKNGIKDEDVINITISTTPDITAFYPARAIREAGHAVPLFSCVEPSIDGALSGCIRVMATADSDNPVRNVYLSGARALRPDIAGRYAIALDGPSGAGKSTVAKLVSKTLGITYLDTGALYRALGLKAIENKVNTKDEKALEKCLDKVEVSLSYENGVQSVLLDGVDVSGRIRTPEVSMAASNVSAAPYVRKKLLGIQRKIAETQSVILDGRDIGTVVLPDAEFKYFLTASAEIRARRRFEELKAKGQNVVYEDVLRDVNERDKNDSTRAVAPLKKAYDAVEINSDDMTAEDVANLIVATVKEDVL
ncbi:MAG: (d)CMP kinase [Clostridiales bacterium]|nr:(d)CMP kinase [Clostridiales bacterium]